MLVSLSSGCCKPTAAHASEFMKLPVLAHHSADEGGAQDEGTFPLSQLPPKGEGSVR